MKKDWKKKKDRKKAGAGPATHTTPAPTGKPAPLSEGAARHTSGAETILFSTKVANALGTTESS